ncbi:MAG: tetraacyldisaccharide 4'-kinase [Bacteroidaceae bacterium]|nr:tetraacyldisaccharide 4'-kinase [Bacteroidaceae bacterium]
MEGDLIHINHWLCPLSWCYGVGVAARNMLFDCGVLHEHEYDLPVICIGNISVGGTGKTPHTEYLLKMLLPKYRVAVLSRGYKRKSRGYLLSTDKTSVDAIGDEPWQMKHKFPSAIVAVDANRRHGISRLMTDEATRDLQVILLDDAFQHRYVKAGLNIVLVDYHRLVTYDKLLPAGRLREPVSSLVRANIVIVTKCPANMTPMEFRVVRNNLNLRPYQQLFFSTFRYGNLRPLFETSDGNSQQLTSDTHVLLLTGIASPEQMKMDLQRTTRHITPLFFGDHHSFTRSDIERIEREFTAMQGSKRLIVTTEKDGSRLLNSSGLSTIVRRHTYVLPIDVEIMQDQEAQFRTMVLDFIKDMQKT